ncbi:serine/threonine protein kinase [Trichophyton rubrum D6]|nr:serine/threonine protein kinase [Trichophyton rubrum MR850]EZF87283.1 serine/threonine protein kinase [Trichophyton rubrum MR1448]EZG19553.1 serine/threonine protein kinase [Trichophyton rubrum CBS 202.88]KDB36517.1 serine/threonine protein kinase [Trichophyton rubrum D6]KMQ45056.1 Serine-threonine/tyrosine-protein kinase catalytic domain [Trichophyton rubrum]
MELATQHPAYVVPRRTQTIDGPKRFPGVQWIWRGAILVVYEVHPQIVVKVPIPEERESFANEIKIYEAFSTRPPCPSTVQCFYYTENGIFLEYMRDSTLSVRIQHNQVRDESTEVVTKIEKLEPIALRKRWMNDLAQAVAFLQSLNLAHGDLRPENVLLDGCGAPYRRFMNGTEPGEEANDTSAGNLSPRTEQFALGSLYYFINYSFEVYGDRCLDPDNPREHGFKMIGLLQNLIFPELNGDSLIDDIIHKCWHNKYRKVTDLAEYTEALLVKEPSAAEDTEAGSSEDATWKKVLCQDLEYRGLLEFLCSDEPVKLGFPLGWYKYSETA